MCQELTQVLKIHCWLKITALQHMGCGFKQAQVRDPKPLGQVPNLLDAHQQPRAVIPTSQGHYEK